MGSVWSRLGSEVHVIEFMDHITSGMDREISNEFMKILAKQGIKFSLETKVNKILKLSNSVKLETTNKDGKNNILEADKVLISIGRKPNTESLQLDKIGVKLDKKGSISVQNNYETSVKNIFAIGDVISGPMLAHKAEEEGIAVAEIIAGQSGHCLLYTSPSPRDS